MIVPCMIFEISWGIRPQREHLRGPIDGGEEQRRERDAGRVVATEERDRDARETEERARQLFVVAVELRIAEQRTDGRRGRRCRR